MEWEVGRDSVIVENNGGRLALKTLDVGDDAIQDRLDVIDNQGHLGSGQVVRTETLYKM